MKANPLYLLIGLYPRLKVFLLQILGALTAEVGLVLKLDQDSVVRRHETRVLPRAERFAIETTIRYRHVGQSRWYEGKTENISGTGVLFRAPKQLALKTRVEMVFPLLNKSSGVSGANVRCFGQIVRKVAALGPKAETGLAATIENYLLAHAEEAT